MLKIPNTRMYLETINPRIYNIMTKRKKNKRTNNDLQNTTQKTKD